MKIDRKNKGFNKCCAEEIRDIWIRYCGSEHIVMLETKCPECGHYIGLTQTHKNSANEFLINFGLQTI